MTEQDPQNDEVDDEVKELMADHDLEVEEAEKAKEVMDELGLDEDDAIEIAQSL